MLHTPRSFVSHAVRPGVAAVPRQLSTSSNSGPPPCPMMAGITSRPDLEGRFWQVPKWWSWDAFMSTDYRREFALDMGTWNAGGALYPDWKERNFRIEPIWRPNDHFRVSHVYSHQDKFNERGWSALVDSLAKRHLLGRNQKPLGQAKQLLAHPRPQRLLCAGQPQGHHLPTAALLEPGGKRQLLLLRDDKGCLNPPTTLHPRRRRHQPYDISYNAWSIDCVFRWIFAPGSELSVVWKNLLESQGDMLPDTYAENLEDVLRVPHRNSFSIKAIYFLGLRRPHRASLTVLHGCSPSKVKTLWPMLPAASIAPHPESPASFSPIEHAITQRIAQHAFVQAPAHPVVAAAPFPTVDPAQVILQPRWSISRPPTAGSPNTGATVSCLTSNRPNRSKPHLDEAIALVGHPSASTSPSSSTVHSTIGVPDPMYSTGTGDGQSIV